MKKKINETVMEEFVTEVVKILSEKRFAELKDNELYSVAVGVNSWERKEIYSAADRQVSVTVAPEYGDSIIGKTLPIIKYWNVKKTEEKRKESVLKVD